MGIENYYVKYGSTASICFDCQRACGGCSWSACHPVTGKPLFQPVSGWTAIQTKLYSVSKAKKHLMYSYKVTSCPLFIPDEPRQFQNET